MKKQVLILLLFGFLFPVSAKSQDYFSPRNMLKFADYLYRQQEYLRAAVEYQRYLTTVAPQDSVFYALGLAYKKARKLSAAEQAFRQIPVRFRGSSLVPRAYLQTGFLWVVQDDTAKIARFRQTRLTALKPPNTKEALQTIFGVPLLLHGKFSRAQSYFKQFDRPDFSATDLPFVKTFEKLATSGQKIRRKNPITAAALSAIVPGLGRLYVGRPGDGLYSFVFIGISGFSAYRGFARQGLHSGRGWVLGGLTAALYLGNVYGSYLSAKIVNQKREHDFRTQVVLQLDLWHSTHRLDAFLH